MPRIRLQEQPHYEFHYEVALQPKDINYGGHMGNDALISLINSARTDLFRSLGLSETDLGDGKTGIIMADLAVNYKGEAFLFDVLQIDSHIGEIGRNGFRMYHRVTKEGKVLAFVETGLASFDYGSRRIVSLPAPFIHALENIPLSLSPKLGEKDKRASGGI